jgi:hypothetical protein
MDLGEVGPMVRGGLDVLKAGSVLQHMENWFHER